MYKTASNALLKYLEKCGSNAKMHPVRSRTFRRRFRRLTEVLANTKDKWLLSEAWLTFAESGSDYPKAKLIQAFGFKGLLMEPVKRFRDSVESASRTAQTTITYTVPTVLSGAFADTVMGRVSVPLLGAGSGGGHDAGPAIDTRLFPRTWEGQTACFTCSNPGDQGFKRTPNTSSATLFQSTLPDTESSNASLQSWNHESQDSQDASMASYYIQDRNWMPQTWTSFESG